LHVRISFLLGHTMTGSAAKFNGDTTSVFAQNRVEPLLLIIIQGINRRFHNF